MMTHQNYRNILVIDSAERLSSDNLLSAKALIAEVNTAQPGMPNAAWRIFIVCQTDMWVSGQIHPVIGATAASDYQVKPIAAPIVRQTLRATPRLEWLVAHDEAVAALTNLRTLGWVVEASAQFRQGETGLPSATSRTACGWDGPATRSKFVGC